MNTEKKLRKHRKILFIICLILLFLLILGFFMCRKSYRALSLAKKNLITVIMERDSCLSNTELLRTQLRESRDSLDKYMTWYYDCDSSYHNYQQFINDDDQRRENAWKNYKKKQTQAEKEKVAQEQEKERKRKQELADKELDIDRLNRQMSIEQARADSLKNLFNFNPIITSRGTSTNYSPSPEAGNRKVIYTKYGRTKKRNTYTNYDEDK